MVYFARATGRRLLGVSLTSWPLAAADVPTGGRLIPSSTRVAVTIPCYNEEASIGRVVRDFRRALPQAKIYVYDNASTDATVDRARAAGALVYREPRKGKGNVTRRMLADVDADIYVMVDGDSTYDPSAVPRMVRMLVNNHLDMVVGKRVPVEGDHEVYRPGHAIGNACFNKGLKFALGSGFSDIFSGYRVMSRRFVKSFPARSTGFEIETELTAHAVYVGAACTEVSTAYGSRESGSESKLSTYRDGARILWTIVRLVEAMRPLVFFTFWFALLSILALALGIPVINEFEHTGLVLRFPTAFLAASLQIVAFLSLAAGVILKSVHRLRADARRLEYLRHTAPADDEGLIVDAVGLP